MPTARVEVAHTQRGVADRSARASSAREPAVAVGVAFEPPSPRPAAGGCATSASGSGLAGTRRRAGLALLPLLLLSLLFLLLGGDGDDKRRPPSSGLTRRSLEGVRMPVPTGGTVRVKPIQVVVALGPRVDDARRQRELRALGEWMADNHRSSSRVTVLAGRRVTAPLPAGRLAAGPVGRLRDRPELAVRRALHHRRGFRSLLVRTGGARMTPVPRGTATLRVDGVPGGPNPRRLGGLGPHGSTQVDVDLRRRNALAAVIARAVMAVSRQRER